MRQHNPVYYDYYTSPVGRLLLLVREEKLIYIEFEQEQRTTSLANFLSIEEADEATQAVFKKTMAILARYFAGEVLEFRQLDFLAPEGTPFQQAVWQILRDIPYGTTISYAEIAQKLGKPSAMRAVGGAVGRNPISILIPCHRVLGKGLSLTGFGGGLPNKRFLLQLENIAYKDQGIEFVKPKNKTFL